MSIYHNNSYKPTFYYSFMNDLVVSEPRSELVHEGARCPLYGFGAFDMAFMDTEGNQCAAILQSHCPCYMNIARERVDWDRCRFNTPTLMEGLVRIADTIRVFPRILMPEGVSSWEGVSFRQWYKHVMGRELE